MVRAKDERATHDWRRLESPLARAVALILLLVAAFPFAGPFSRFDHGHVRSATPPVTASAKVKPSLNVSIVGALFTLVSGYAESSSGLLSTRLNRFATATDLHVVLRL